MRRLQAIGMVMVFAATAVLAQAPAEAAGAKSKAAAPVAVPRLSDAARAAMNQAKEMANKAGDLDGEAALPALAAAATAYDKIAADFGAEPSAAAQAAFAAAELWRQHGTAPQAEQDYFLAARLDAERYGQRGRMGAADMQRRQDREAEAVQTYASAVAVDPASSRAQTGRLWQGRLLQRLDRIEEAVAAFRAAVEAAKTPTQVIEASNYLARLFVERGELEAAAQSIARAESSVQTAAITDPVQKDRLQKALDGMSAKKALQRARDKQTGAAGDARMLEQSRGEGR